MRPWGISLLCRASCRGHDPIAVTMCLVSSFFETLCRHQGRQIWIVISRRATCNFFEWRPKSLSALSVYQPVSATAFCALVMIWARLESQNVELRRKQKACETSCTERKHLVCRTMKWFPVKWFTATKKMQLEIRRMALKTLDLARSCGGR